MSDKKQSSASLVQIKPTKNPLNQLIRNQFGTFKGLVRLFLANIEKYLGRLNQYKVNDKELATYKRLVFVCQGNICRSAYADFKAKTLNLPAVSIGLATSTGQPAFQLTQTTAKKHGLDLTTHRSTDIHDFDIQVGDLFLVMEIRQAKKLEAMNLPANTGIVLLGFWTSPLRIHIHDPFELEENYFDRCFSVIDNSIENLAKSWKKSHL